MSTRHTRIATSIGTLTLVADRETLTGVYFPHHWHPPAPGTIGPYVDAKADPVLAAASRELEEFLASRRTEFEVPVATCGDPFQEEVWALLREVPYGATTTYGLLAAQLGDPTLAQRVGQAVGRNPLSIVIPCHRVVGKNGHLTGYAGGLDRKRRLLVLEQPQPAEVGRLF